jgi:phage terminase large subunit-like protein
LKKAEILKIVAALSDEEVKDLVDDWRFWARPEQLPPQGNWTTWLLMGGRGSGKTRAGAEWVRELVFPTGGALPVTPIALVAENLSEARAVMVEGCSGILNIGPVSERPRFDKTRNLLVWKNGAEAHLMSASEPERFRGPQFAAAWCDEVAKWPNAETAWDMLQFALRLGDHPRQMATTTPRPTKLLRRLLGDSKTFVAHMPTKDNADNLAPGFLERIVGRYRDTLLGRQELDGELIEDMPDALWSRRALEALRQSGPVELERVIVSVDPAVSAHAKSDACGIIVAGRAGEGAIVLADKTLKPAPPLKWARVVVRAFHQYGADAIVAEVNQGGDLVASLIAQIDPLVPVLQVRANRSKWVRAEPVAALYERGLVHHRPGLNDLEDEMCTFGPDGLAEGHSPDRVDALVWALSTLLLNSPAPRVRGL